MKDFDYILVGGGLQNGLITLAVLHACPQARIALVEQNNRLGGNQTWSAHALDVPCGAYAWMEPLFERRWKCYEVVFPGLRRLIHRAYGTIPADRLDRVVREELSKNRACRLYTGRTATRLTSHEVELDHKERLHAQTVIDARGLELRVNLHETSGYQKFLGLEVLLDKPWDTNHPIVMDATVEQIDGYRFMYVLPFSDRRVLVEDTCFSNHPEYDDSKARVHIEKYLYNRGIKILKTVRQETGVLSMPWGKSTCLNFLTAGWRGGWFHPATGYSMPAAVRLAGMVAEDAPKRPDRHKVGRLIKKLSIQMRFARRLNQMLFRWIRPERRVEIFERFYRLPSDTITRFYAMDTNFMDRIRIMVDRPPFAPWFRIPGRRDTA